MPVSLMYLELYTYVELYKYIYTVYAGVAHVFRAIIILM